MRKTRERKREMTKHPFVSTPDNGPCSSCGLERWNPIHALERRGRVKEKEAIQRN